MTNTSNINILIIPDEELSEEYYQKSLNKQEISCCYITNFQQIIAFIEQSPPDLLIADIDLLTESLLSQIRKISPFTLVIALGKKQLYPSKTGSQGLFDYLIKPVSATLLSESVEKAVNYLKIWHQKDYGRLVQLTKLARVGELTTEIVHDIKTPMTSILGFISLFLRFLNKENVSVEELQRVRHYLTSAHSETQRCKDMLDEILLFSRKESQEFQDFSFKEVILKSCKLLRKKFDKSRVKVITEIPENFPNAWGNPNKIQQVLMNLLTNAHNAMPDGGEIKISAQSLEKEIKVVVADTGVGIAPQDVHKIFDSFFTTKKAGQGTGLGLSISKKILREHGGEIKLHSIPGRGSSFTICLPHK